MQMEPEFRENFRVARSPSDDPFDQQQQDVSAFVLKGDGFQQQQQKVIPFRKDDIENNPNHDVEEIHPETYSRRGRARIPIYPPISLHDDTLVNDLLLNDVRK